MRISVCMATYNGARYLREQLESILIQMDRLDEMIVVDDGSSDDTVAMLRALGDGRVKLLLNERNHGPIRSFERALEQARGDLVLLADQDDVWLPGKRDAIVAAFERHPSAQVVVSDAQVIDAHGSLSMPSFMATRGGFRPGLFSTLWKNRYLGCAMAVRRQALAAALPIPRRVPMHDMWLGTVGSLIGDVVYLSTALIRYRRHGDNASPSRPQGIVRMLRWRWALVISVVARWPRIARCRATLRRRPRAAPL
jgi:glycosyltransferase involved in cell wall biosynthesis